MAGDSITPLKTCTKCGEVKPVTEFAKLKTGAHGVRGDCKACRREISRAWYAGLDQNDRSARYQRYRDANKGYLEAWLTENKERKREYARRSIRKSRSTPGGRLKSNIARAVHIALKGGKSGGSTFLLLGYSVPDLMRHIERQFLPGMSWDNYARDGWHVDHIRPLCSFTYETSDDPQFRAAWALANLRPLWAKDNLRKGGRAVLLA